MDGTKIQWTDATWNPIRGCSRISPGCVNCYAEKVAARFSGPGLPYEGLARMTSGGPRWTGKVKLFPELLDQPRRWQRPRRIFVNSMSDLFHETLTENEIRQVFGAIFLAPQHTFQILTKRALRMRAVLSAWRNADPAWHPGPKTWLGVSVENQAAADERIPALLDTPAAVRWLSVEPMIGPVRIPRGWLRELDWIVIGGESGTGAREFAIDWARDLIAAARKAGTRVFVKQLGSDPIRIVGATGNFRTNPATGKRQVELVSEEIKLADRKGGTMDEWPEDLRIREWPASQEPH